MKLFALASLLLLQVLQVKATTCPLSSYSCSTSSADLKTKTQAFFTCGVNAANGDTLQAKSECNKIQTNLAGCAAVWTGVGCNCTAMDNPTCHTGAAGPVLVTIPGQATCTEPYELIGDGLSAQTPVVVPVGSYLRLQAFTSDANFPPSLFSWTWSDVSGKYKLSDPAIRLSPEFGPALTLFINPQVFNCSGSTTMELQANAKGTTHQGKMQFGTNKLSLFIKPSCGFPAITSITPNDLTPTIGGAGDIVVSIATPTVQLVPTSAVTIANPGFITLPNHGFEAGQKITYVAGGAAIAGLTDGEEYYVSQQGFGTGRFELALDKAAATGNPSFQSIQFTGSGNNNQKFILKTSMRYGYYEDLGNGKFGPKTLLRDFALGTTVRLTRFLPYGKLKLFVEVKDEQTSAVKSKTANLTVSGTATTNAAKVVWLGTAGKGVFASLATALGGVANCAVNTCQDILQIATCMAQVSTQVTTVAPTEPNNNATEVREAVLDALNKLKAEANIGGSPLMSGLVASSRIPGVLISSHITISLFILDAIVTKWKVALALDKQEQLPIASAMEAMSNLLQGTSDKSLMANITSRLDILLNLALSTTTTGNGVYFKTAMFRSEARRIYPRAANKVNGIYFKNLTSILSKVPATQLNDPINLHVTRFYFTTVWDTPGLTAAPDTSKASGLGSLVGGSVGVGEGVEFAKRLYRLSDTFRIKMFENTPPRKVIVLTTQVNIATNRIDTTTTGFHNFAIGEKIRYSSSGKTVAAGLTDGNYYYVGKNGHTTQIFELYPTLLDANSGTNVVDITGTGNNYQTFTSEAQTYPEIDTTKASLNPSQGSYLTTMRFPYLYVAYSKFVKSGTSSGNEVVDPTTALAELPNDSDKVSSGNLPGDSNGGVIADTTGSDTAAATSYFHSTLFMDTFAYNPFWASSSAFKVDSAFSTVSNSVDQNAPAQESWFYGKCCNKDQYTEVVERTALSNTFNNAAPQCSVWDTTAKDWVTTGCSTTVLRSDDGTKNVECTCSKAADMALLLKPVQVMGRPIFIPMIVVYLFVAAAAGVQLKRIHSTAGFRYYIMNAQMGFIIAFCVVKVLIHALFAFGSEDSLPHFDRALLLELPHVVMFFVYQSIFFGWATLYRYGTDNPASPTRKMCCIFLPLNLLVVFIIGFFWAIIGMSTDSRAKEWWCIVGFAVGITLLFLMNVIFQSCGDCLTKKLVLDIPKDYGFKILKVSGIFSIMFVIQGFIQSVAFFTPVCYNDFFDIFTMFYGLTEVVMFALIIWTFNEIIMRHNKKCAANKNSLTMTLMNIKQLKKQVKNYEKANGINQKKSVVAVAPADDAEPDEAEGAWGEQQQSRSVSPPPPPPPPPMADAPSDEDLETERTEGDFEGDEQGDEQGDQGQEEPFSPPAPVAPQRAALTAEEYASVKAQCDAWDHEQLFFGHLGLPNIFNGTKMDKAGEPSRMQKMMAKKEAQANARKRAQQKKKSKPKPASVEKSVEMDNGDLPGSVAE